MHRNACSFANGIKARNDDFRIVTNLSDNLTMIIARNSAHIVVNRWCHWQWLACQVDAGENLSAFSDAGQTLRQNLGIDVIEMQVDMILMRTDTTAFAHFKCHRAADNVA